MHSIENDSHGFKLTAQILKAGSDLMVLVTGGEKPHIGAVASAVFRPSLKDEKKNSATASVFCYVGHKEDEIAKYMAEKIAAHTANKVVVACGMHWPNLAIDDIKQVKASAKDLLKKILEAF